MEYKKGEVGLYFIKEGTDIKVTQAKDIFDKCFNFYNELDFDHKETFLVFALSNSNEILTFKRFEGNLSACMVDPKQIFQFALLSNASAIIISHNHPSGKLMPSDADKTITKKLKEGSKLLDITFLDHIIVTRNGFFSFANEGIL